MTIEKIRPFSRPALFSAFLSLALLAPQVMAGTQVQYLNNTKKMLRDAVAFKTVKGNKKVSKFANYLAEKLESSGFSKSDINITRVNDTAALTVRYAGQTDEKPILLLGHMDVVPVNSPEKWTTKNPFKLTKKNGFFTGAAHMI